MEIDNTAYTSSFNPSVLEKFCKQMSAGHGFILDRQSPPTSRRYFEALQCIVHSSHSSLQLCRTRRLLQVSGRSVVMHEVIGKTVTMTQAAVNSRW